MPIYAYRCEACGFAKDVLQKMSEDPLTVCPECQQASFKKQITAAGFQLKGSGWYVTDFRGGAGTSNSNSTSHPTNRAENSAENSNHSAENNTNGNANSANANNTANSNTNNANNANDSKAA